jgi:hypothetical protein
MQKDELKVFIFLCIQAALNFKSVVTEMHIISRILIQRVRAVKKEQWVATVYYELKRECAPCTHAENECYAARLETSRVNFKCQDEKCNLAGALSQPARHLTWVTRTLGSG